MTNLATIGRPASVELSLAEASDLALFTSLRTSVMREHVLLQRLPLDEAGERAYHRHLFALRGLYRISLDGKVIGFIGLRAIRKGVELSRFCIAKRWQNKGIGSGILNFVLNEAVRCGVPIYLEILRMNRARFLYERFGFRLYREGKKMAFYRFIPVSSNVLDVRSHAAPFEM